MLDWIGDNAPAWIAALTALVVGGYSIVNVNIARRAYQDSVTAREVAQARLVWAQVGGHVGKHAESSPGDMGEKYLGRGRLFDRQDDYEGRSENGDTKVVIARELTIFEVKLVNNGNEPIGRCRVTLSGSWRTSATRPIEGPPRWEHTPIELVAKVLPPQSERTIRVAVPIAFDDLNPLKAQVRLSFIDSAGLRWSRSGTLPPKKANGTQSREGWLRRRLWS
ncbi:hypothetical protein KUV85_16060 [Nocardioides panacisoli]|uniref:hypothetical protein n=1 Tax=Nocardioides panacisoli TaxID=627624 RepID=UPI001C62AFD4|nr:hypothetical protein [Nocardioides panacisoli]QYJ03820.1 hypothetical protein KUV85_16060 [Nocardioides panacisoli]